MAEPQGQSPAVEAPYSTKDGLEKDGTDPETENQDSGEAVDAEYPQGISLVLIVAAVVLAIFLISLDQVSTLVQPIKKNQKLYVLTIPDHSRHGDSQNHRSIRRAGQGVLVRFGILHDIWRLPTSAW